MPRYRNEFGCVVDISEELAARINGLTPVDTSPPATRKRAAPRKPKQQKTESSDDE